MTNYSQALMQGGGEPGIIRRWLELAAGEADSARRGELAILTLTLSELTDHSPAWQEALEGWNMQESQTALKWINEGHKEGLRQTLRRQLEKRFGVLPLSLVERIEAADVPGLDAALLQVLDIDALSDLQF